MEQNGEGCFQGIYDAFIKAKGMTTANFDFPDAAEGKTGAPNTPEPEPEVAAKRTGGSRRLWPVTAAGAVSGLWLILTGWLLYRTGLNSVIGLPVTDLAALVAGVATPIAIAWLIALAFQRTDPLIERRVALAQHLHRAMSPVEAAEVRLAQLHKGIIKELDHIDAVADLASDRVKHLENRFQEQISNLFTATADAEARTSSIRDTLARERDAVSALVTNVEDRINGLEAQMGEIRARMAEAGEKAAETARDARSHLDESLGTLNDSSEDVAKRLADTGDLMDGKAKSLQQLAVDVELRLQSVGDFLHGGVEKLRKDVIGLEGRSAELSDHMKTQAHVLHELAELAAGESAKIENSLKAHVETVKSAAEEALSKTSDVNTQVSKQAGSMTDLVVGTVERAQSLLSEAGSAFAEHCERALETSRTIHERALAQADSAETQLAANSERLAELFDQNLARMTAHLNNAANEIERQMSALDNAGRTTGDSLETQANRLAENSASLAGAASDAAGTMEGVRSRMDEHQMALSEGLQETRRKLSHLEEDLRNERDALIATSDDAGNRLLEATERFAERARALSDAAETSEDRLDGARAKVGNLMRSLADEAEAAHERMVAVAGKFGNDSEGLREELSAAGRSLGAAADAFAGERGKIRQEAEKVVTRLNTAADGLSREVDRFAEGSMEAATRLDSASQTLMDETSRAREAMRHAVSDTKTELSAGLDELSTQATERVTFLKEEMQATLSRMLADYQETADTAEKEGAFLAVRLGREAEKIAEKAAQFIAQSAELEKRAAKSGKSDFTRTSKLLMESLHSLSIDIDKALSQDIPDSAWQAYLNGDRSIFIRRTLGRADRRVKKLIGEKFRGDTEFKEAATRYMRDFETMMERAMVGERDNTLSVTLISSDMGKLYVLLAQALKKMS
ncbi:hypothetical protein BXY39_1629 [Eilatimonas milleporae]|uniref:Apolipoprotein A1/A4/E domain-containing protein n=2 Tax=Eilatimonas milleporae TaxID=911205 RepID=A0A3M0CI29_9PROT|nr:hypothetical protein BXY39_1629 [Eilatimonas milleporae]